MMPQDAGHHADLFDEKRKDEERKDPEEYVRMQTQRERKKIRGIPTVYVFFLPSFFHCRFLCAK